MNAERLLQLFERVVDAPDAVAKLRRLILDLAVRGKLVEQSTDDEPARVLLERIHDKKEQLIDGRKIKRSNAIFPNNDDFKVFDIPKSWIWSFVRGVSYDFGQKAPDKDFTYIDVSSVDNEKGIIETLSILKPEEAPSRARKLAKLGSVLYSTIRPYLKNVVILNRDFDPSPIVSTAFAVLHPYEGIHSRFLWYWLRSPVFTEIVSEKMRGQAYPAINDRDLAGLPVALPPSKEQHRIVQRVDELMALCDQLEATQTEREHRRDQLNAAALKQLVEAEPGADGIGNPARHSARFYLNRLPRLTTKVEHVKALRQTILDLAVRGRLVAQDLEDEPASELLISISKNLKKIIAALDLRRQPAIAKIDLAPFAVPQNWIWTLVDNCFVVTGGIQKTPKRAPKDNAFPYVGVSNVYRGYLELSEVKQFELGTGELEKLRLEPEDLLVVEGNGGATEIGRCARWKGEINNCVHQNHIIRCRPGNKKISQFVELFLNSSLGIEIMMRLAVTSAGLYNLSVGKIRKIPLPLPPLAEQHRIVAKVDELMALCDQLEAAIKAKQHATSRLLDALIAEALADSPEPQAVEAGVQLALGF